MQRLSYSALVLSILAGPWLLPSFAQAEDNPPEKPIPPPAYCRVSSIKLKPQPETVTSNTPKNLTEAQADCQKNYEAACNKAVTAINRKCAAQCAKYHKYDGEDDSPESPNVEPNVSCHVPGVTYVVILGHQFPVHVPPVDKAPIDEYDNAFCAFDQANTKATVTCTVSGTCRCDP